MASFPSQPDFSGSDARDSIDIYINY